jgi:hypothetical protein
MEAQNRQNPLKFSLRVCKPDRLPGIFDADPESKRPIQKPDLWRGRRRDWQPSPAIGINAVADCEVAIDLPIVRVRLIAPAQQ